MNGTIHHLGGTVGGVIEKAQDAEAVVVIFRMPGEGWRIGWSNMTTGDLCFARCALEILVQQCVADGYQEGA